MCGIAGYFGNDNIEFEKIVTILKNQMHRGSDSTGIAWINNDVIYHKKDTIPPNKFVAPNGNANLIIAHNRAASIGSVSIRNAHPIVNEDRTIGVVHNGHYSNYSIFKKLLEKNHRFIGETDTEVLLHLYEEIGDDISELQFGVMLLIDHGKLKIIKSGYNPAIIARNKQESHVFIASEYDAITSIINKDEYNEYKFYELLDGIVTLIDKNGHVKLQLSESAKISEYKPIEYKGLTKQQSYHYSYDWYKKYDNKYDWRYYYDW